MQKYVEAIKKTKSLMIVMIVMIVMIAMIVMIVIAMIVRGRNCRTVPQVHNRIRMSFHQIVLVCDKHSILS